MKIRSPSTIHPLPALLGWLVLCFSAGVTGIFIDTGSWYAALEKPSWNPPGWVFGPVWTVLYAMMAVAAWRVWQHGGWRRQYRALGWFILQWALNVAWTPLFFGLQRPDLALAAILLLWVAILFTLRAFRRVDRAAMLWLLPYLAWVSFAAILNFFIWRLNPPA